ncbi:MAG TPA: SEC-C metal-binding domain-containing protein, partial [Bacteroidales bacterium]|nr:SEC-C metal-binding domain-containing protein [Bacteroidales bacterium]
LAGLIRRGYPATEVMKVLALEEAFARAGRNDPCPCGSGRKFKRCHGLRKNNAKRETRSR